MAVPAAIDYSLLGGVEELPPSHVQLGRDGSASSSSASDDDVSDSAIDSSGSASAFSRRPRRRSSHKRAAVDKTDWLWALTEEPHRSRRRAILAKHPEISKLMGHEPLTKYIVVAVVALQLVCAALLRHSHPLSWRFLATSYVIGATANQNLFLAIHEITHNLAFRGIKGNRMFAIFANLPIGVPYAMLFKPYHIEHHKHLGEDGIDTDLPTRLELLCLNNVLGKTFFCAFQILFYALRPGFVRVQRFSPWAATNFAVQGLVSFSVYRWLGGPALLYLLVSSLLAGSLHPCAAHFIAEHYVFDPASPNQDETFSYYGPLNALTYNVGYHNEHHDFPSIPWTRLPALHRIAHEFYDDLPQCSSWPMVTVRFLLDDSVGMHSRVKRAPNPPRAERDKVAANAVSRTRLVSDQGGKGDAGGVLD